MDELRETSALERSRRQGDVVFLQGAAKLRLLRFREARDPVMTAQLSQPGHGLLLETAFTEQTHQLSPVWSDGTADAS